MSYKITICCSRRFKKEARDFASQLRALGLTVYEPPLYSTPPGKTFTKEQKYAIAAGFTYRHFEKIRKSDAIFVLNKDHYMGISTTFEIGYAAALHKRIFFMEDDDDYPRKILIENITKTPDELLTALQQGKTYDIMD